MIQNGVLLVVVALTLKETIRKVTGDDRYIAEIELEARNFSELLVQSRSVSEISDSST
jgi:sulfur transfer complex TusBCD TusB component (DsrH family)